MTESDEYYCESCGQTFNKRDEFVSGLLFAGQSVSKGSRSRVEQVCCHDMSSKD